MFFPESSSPKPLKITLGVFPNFFKNLQRYSQVKVQHRYQRQFVTGVNDTGGKLPPVSTTPVANLPPVCTFELRPKKFETALMEYSGAWGKLIHKKPEVENLMALSLYYTGINSEP
jgi:hypothetical protein